VSGCCDGQTDEVIVAQGRDRFQRHVAGALDHVHGAVRRQGTCEHRKGIRRQTLEAVVVDALKNNLMHPDVVGAFVGEFHPEVDRQRHALERHAGVKRRPLEDVRRKLDGLITAIADGLRSPGMQAKLDELEQRRMCVR
jgi:hypothetical protein